MRLAICPGSFDPITVGHLDMIRRAAALFDEVLVLISPNSEKNPMFSAQTRLELLQLALADIPNVRAAAEGGLLADIARREGACALVKGVRDGQDLSYEQMLAQVNKHLAPGLETVLLPADPATVWISSTVVREMIRYHQDISEMVPAAVLDRLSVLLQEGNDQ